MASSILRKGNIAVVVGGAGSLGKAILTKCSTLGMTTVSVDFKESSSALMSYTMNPELPVKDQVKSLREELVEKLVCPKDRAYGVGAGMVVHAAGAWKGGSIDSEDILETASMMYKSNLESSLLASHLACHLLTPKGLLVLTGALAAVHPTPTMIAYGVSKVATHQLVGSIAATESARDGNWDVIGLLPRIIDTPANRQIMPDADTTDWTELDDIAEICTDWFENESMRPESGSLVQVQTSDGLTSWNVVNQDVHEREIEI
mmetsp:Transcript_21754/g.28163  ORF Transcript_21754/g.28163 Transcript_21754/m.28163 type:complete len:261 (-) Transcript_21754:56-838(-)